ncbi:MAG: nucleotidyltransferase [Ignavibacteriae bacterium HGW-Ignavibacteriae-4]|jgi:hypothetical protein|nr:MAG: nucleotidyltransferase [Ignavibacteriae bacterium HGW-Ignavibacteriae-4]
MEKIIQNNIDKIKELCLLHKVKSLSLFGSITKNKFNSDSDIDFLVAFDNMSHVEYADNYFILIEKLESLLKRKIDLVTDKSLSNPYLINSINKSKVHIYGQPN